MKPHAVSTAVSEANLEIPLIDFSAFLTGDAATKKSTAQAILAGFQTAGFVYLSKHGVPEDVLERTFAESAKFFKRPRGEKDALAWTTPEVCFCFCYFGKNLTILFLLLLLPRLRDLADDFFFLFSIQANRGYSQPGREKVTDAETPEEIEQIRAKEGSDLKESLEIGKEGEPGMPNPWPRQDAAGIRFREQMLQFFDECKILHINIMRAIAVGLNLEEKWFDRYCDAGDNTLRLLHYPEVPADVFRRRQEQQENDVVEQVRAGAHTDYGSITCLFQDMAGGLQVKSPTGKFVNATPIEGTVVVNAGDLLARWSNDVIKSTVHRVVEPPTKSTVHPARYTVRGCFFFFPFCFPSPFLPPQRLFTYE